MGERRCQGECGKSEIMYFGGGVQEKVNLGLAEKEDYLRILGVLLGRDWKGGRDRLYEQMINKMRKTLGYWKPANVKIKGEGFDGKYAHYEQTGACDRCIRCTRECS